MSQPTRNFSVLAQTYQSKKGHGIFKNHAYYHSDEERMKKKKGERKEWFYECINRFEKNPQVKCIAFNHKAQSAWLYEHYVPSALIDKDNRDRDYKLKNGEPTKRHTWHTFIIFD